jgi:hypothetical protein
MFAVPITTGGTLERRADKFYSMWFSPCPKTAVALILEK